MTEDDPRSGSTVWRRPEPEPPRHGYFWMLWPVAVFALVVVVGRIVLAAEPDRRVPYEITLHFPGNVYDDVSRTHMVLGQPYESKEACRNAISRVRVLVYGARLKCDPVGDGSLRR